MEFRCRLASANGEIVEGVYVAENEARLRQEFEDKGLFVLSLQPKGSIGGLELSAAYKTKTLNAYANMAFSRARGRNIATGQFNFDPDELAYIADHWVHLDHEQTVSGSAGVSYRWGETTLGADLIYGSGLRRGFANTDHLPGYGQVNVSAARTFGKVDLRLAVLNVFDHSYQIRDGSGIGVGAPQFGQRRGFYGTVAFAF